MMTAEEAAESGKNLSFEKVWAAFVETDRKMAENARLVAEAQAEAERKYKEDQAENAKLVAEAQAEAARLVAEADRKYKEARAEAARKYEEAQAENARLVAEARAEAERLVAEARAEAAKKYEEAQAENARIVAEATKKAEEARAAADRQSEKTERQFEDMMKTVKRVTKNVGGLNRSLGALIETLIAAHLWEKFPQYNLTSAAQRVSILDEKGEVKTDIDILLVNSTVCIAVEVKYELNHAEDVDHHIKRMELIRHYQPELVKGKQLLGAMAGGVVDPDVKNYAYRAGFFVLGLAGESVRLIPPPEGFQPRAW